VIVENKVGAGGNIGADAVAKARWRHHRPDDQRQPDHRQAAQPALRYDPATDFAPISLIGVAPLVLVAPVSAPGADALPGRRAPGRRTLELRLARRGTVGHLGMELLKARTGIAPVHVPYPGYPQVFSGLAGELQLMRRRRWPWPRSPPASCAASASPAAGAPLMPGAAQPGRCGREELQPRDLERRGGPASMPRPTWPSWPRCWAPSCARPRCARNCSSRAGRPWALRRGLARRIKADTTSLGTIIAQNIRVQ
jgi:hypothetical protein